MPSPFILYPDPSCKLMMKERIMTRLEMQGESALHAGSSTTRGRSTRAAPRRGRRFFFILTCVQY